MTSPHLIVKESIAKNHQEVKKKIKEGLGII